MMNTAEVDVNLYQYSFSSRVTGEVFEDNPYMEARSRLLSDGSVELITRWVFPRIPETERWTFYQFSPNVEAIRDALEHITYHPETWHQGDWLRALAGSAESPSPECGTAGCLAGTAAMQAGAKPWADAEGYTPQEMREMVSWEQVKTVEGDIVLVESYANEIMGLTQGYNINLFGGSNSLQGLWDRAFVLTAGRLEVPPVEVIAEAQRISEHLYGSSID